MCPKKKYLLRLLQTVVSIALVWYLLRLIDWLAVERLLASGIFPALWPGPPILLLGLLLAAERWRAVLRFFGLSLRLSEAFMLYLIGNFYSVLLPGVLGGDVVRAAMCRVKTGGATGVVLASVGIERGLGLWGMTLIGTFGVLGVVLHMPISLDVFTLILSPLMAVGIPLGTYLVYVFAGYAVKLEVRHGLAAKIIEMLRQFAVRMRELPSRLALRTLLFSTAFQASEIFIYFYFGHIMQMNVPFVFYIFAIPLVYLATVLPISLGGIGVREGVLVWLFSIIGVAASDAALLAFLVYLNRLLVGAIGGVVHAVHKVGR